jgi:DNA-binding PadR family transcriptional regulator
MKRDSLLVYALLGLVHQKPMSGYGVRNLFATSAMGTYSDSPGSIYPALRRLEARGWIQGSAQRSAGLRKRRVFRTTADGVKALKAWLKQPLTRDDVIRDTGQLMLRFAFIDHTLGAEEAARFLREYSLELSAFIPELLEYHQKHAHEMPMSSRLAFECGIQGFKARQRWAKRSAALYERKGNQP